MTKKTQKAMTISNATAIVEYGEPHPQSLDRSQIKPREDFRNILIVRLSALGDVIQALPSLELLRAHFPQAKISWVVEDRAAAMLRNHPQLDEVIEMPRRAWKKMKADGASQLQILKEMWRFGRGLKASGFDLALDFQGNIKSGLVTRASGAPLRCGFARGTGKEPNWLFTNRQVPMKGRVMHRIERDLRLLGAIDVPFEFVWPKLSYSDAEKQAVDEIFKEKATGPVVVLHPGTSHFLRNKRWPPEYYANLADLLVEQRGARVLVSWGPGDEEVLEALEAAAVHPLERMPWLPSMREVGYFMSCADLVIGGDTGPVHLAAMQQVPTITVIGGSSDPRFYYPYQHPERALYAGIACSPCRYRACPSRDCMALIGVQDVMNKVLAVLDGGQEVIENLIPNKTIKI